MAYGWGWHDQSWGPGMWIVAVVAMIAFWSLVVFAIVMLVRHFGRPAGTTPGGTPGAGPPGDDAVQVLRQRFARGEIDEEEFQRRMALLERKT